MSEIEKMYENAGVEKEFEKPAECTKNPYITCDGCMFYDDKKGKCNKVWVVQVKRNGINTVVGTTTNLEKAVLMRDKYLKQLLDIEEIK